MLIFNGAVVVVSGCSCMGLCTVVATLGQSPEHVKSHVARHSDEEVVELHDVWQASLQIERHLDVGLPSTLICT